MSVERLEDRCLLATVDWINPAGGSWAVAGNWRDDLGVSRLPTAADDVVIDQPGSIVITHASGTDAVRSLTSNQALAITGGSLSLAAASTIATNFSLANGTLTGAGDLTVSGTLHWSGGTMSGSGSTVVGAAGTLTMDTSAKYLDGRTLTNRGTATLAGSQYLYIRNGATLNNQAGATFSLLSDTYVWNDSATVSSVNNAGTLRKTAGTGSTVFYGGLAVSNSGLLEAQTGTLEFGLYNGGSAASQSEVRALAGANVQLSTGTLTLSDGASITGAGKLRNTSGTLALAAAANVAAQNVELTNGTLTGAGVLTVDGTLRWSGGTMSGSGSTVIGSSGTLTMNTSAKYLDGRTLTNNGTATLAGSQYLYIRNGATLNNQAGATFSLLSDTYVWNDSPTVSAFNTAGTLRKTAGTGSTVFYGALAVSNSGLLEAQTGTLDLGLYGGGSASSQSEVRALAGANVLVSSGTLTLNDGASITGAGKLRITSGTLTLATSVTAQNVELTNGTITGAGELTVAGELRWSGGTMSGSGGTVISSTGTLTMDTSAKYLVGRTLTNRGTATLAGPQYLYIRNGATLNNQAGATLSLLSDTYLWNDTPTTSTINNAGTLRKTAGTGSTVFYGALALNNSGTLAAQSGTVDLGATLTNFANKTLTGGTYSVVGPGRLRFDNADVRVLSAVVILDGPASQIVDGANRDALAGLSSITDSGSLALQNGRSVSTTALVNQGAVSIGAGSTLTASGQYANSVLGFSSQYGTSTWAAVQALGPPDVPSYGDNPKAWAPSPQNGTAEYLTVGFPAPASSRGVKVRETYGNGFVTRIDALDTSDVYHTVWTGTDPSLPGSPVDFVATWAPTSYPTKGVKIYVNTNHNPSTWEEIDAVQLLAASYVQTSGSTTLAGGTLAAEVAIQGGGLSGSGTVTQGLTNAGQLTVGNPLGQLAVGDFTQTATGSTTVQLGGSSPVGGYSVLAVGGTAALDGALTATLVNGFVPVAGQTFQVLTATTVFEQFAAFTAPTFGERESLQVSYHATDVTLTGVIAGIQVSPTEGLTTTAAGGTATFDVVLSSQPSSDVVVSLASSNTAQGTVAPAGLTFTAVNWSTPQTVTVTGVDDYLILGDIAYSIITGSAASDDPTYDGFNPSDVLVTNLETDTLDLQVADLTVSPATLNSGSQVTVRWNDTNTGNSPADGSWADTVVVRNLTTGATLASVQVPHAQADGALAAGAALAREATLTLPAGAAGAGQLEFTVTVDAQGQIAERNAAGNAETNNATTVVRTSTRAAPDLEVANLSSTPASGLQSGDTLTVQWQVRNTGDLSTGTGSWYDGIILTNTTTGEVLANTVLQYNGATAGPLAAGQSVNRQISLVLPDGGRGVGELRIDVTIDVYGQLDEWNAAGTAEANNTAAVTTTSSLAPYPNLTVTNLTVPTAIVAGQYLSVEWTVANTGSAAASGTWSEAVFLSADDTLGNDISLGAFSYSDHLAPGGSAPRSRSLYMSTLYAGTYRVFVVADQSNLVFEENEADNSARAVDPVTIQTVDLIVENVTLTGSHTFGEEATATWTVRNVGDGAAYAAWSDRVYLSSDGVLGGGDVLLDTRAAGSDAALAPGAGYTHSLPVTLPLSGTLDAGDYYLLVVADTQSSQTESNEGNNVGVSPSRTLELPPVPDLIVTAVTAPAEAFSGTDVLVTWTIANQGNGDAAGTWVDRVYLSSSPDGSNASLLGDFSFTGALAAGGTLTRQQAVPIADNGSGNRYLVVETDGYHSIFEHNDDGNNVGVAADPLLVRRSTYPNLQVSAVVVPPSAYSGQQATIEWTVVNVGDGPTSAPSWSDTLWLSADLVRDATDSYLGQAFNLSYLNPGEAYTNSLTVTLPKERVGTFYVLVDADSGRRVLELDAEDDNTGVSAPFDVLLSDPPDLQVTAVTAPDRTFSGQLITATWTVTNLGTAATNVFGATDWTDRIYLSEDLQLDANDIPLYQAQRFQPLAAGASYTLAGSFTTPIHADGQYYLLFQTDAFDQVEELTFEGNNVGHDTDSPELIVDLTPPPDLEITALSVPGTALAGRPLSIGYTVANNGSTTTVAQGWTDSFYLSAGPLFDPHTAIFLGDRLRVGQLPAPGSYSATATPTVPNGLSGEFYLFVLADRKDNVFELDNGNNLARTAAPLTVLLQPPDLVASVTGVPASLVAGTAAVLSWTVTNQGLGDTLVARWDDRLYLSTDDGLDPSDVLLATRTHAGLLGPGDAYTQSASVYLPIQFGGPLYLLAVTDVDPLHPVYEGPGENNNVSAALAIEVAQPLPDLQVRDIMVPASAVSGQPLGVTWTVDNLGTRETGLNYWFDDLYLSADGQPGGAPDILLGRVRHAENLAAGSSYTATASLIVPLDLQGSFQVLVRTDSPDNFQGAFQADATTFDRVFEAGGSSNNTLAALAPVDVVRAPVPNFVVTSVSAPLDAITGQPLDVTWTVRNDGTAPNTKSWYDGVYLSRDQLFDRAQDAYLGYYGRIDPIAPGDTYTSTAAFVVPAGLSGPFYVLVVADRGNTVAELDGEYDNTGAAAAATLVTLAAPADLVVGTITVPATGQPGLTAIIDYTVFNQGLNDARGSWFDSLYLSADGQWDLGDPLMGRVYHQGTVAAGESYSEQLTAALPALSPGEYHVILRTDINNYVPEADESNNVAASLDRVVLDVPELTLGVTASGFVKKGDSRYYRVDAAAGETLRVRVHGFAPLVSEVYVSQGTVPTRTRFEYGYGTAVSPDQEVVVETTEAGTYYVLMHGREARTEGSSFSITAELVQFSVSRVDLPRVGDSSVTMLVDGAKFDAQTTFALVDSQGAVFPATGHRLLDSTQALVTFDLTGAASGPAAVDATQGPVTVSLANATTIVVGSRGALSVKLDAPSAMRAGATGLWYINYANGGTTDIDVPLLFFGVPSAEFVGRTPHGENLGPYVWFLGVPQGHLLAKLRPGESGRIELYCRLSEASVSVLTAVDPQTALLQDVRVDYEELLADLPDGPTPRNQQFIQEMRNYYGETLADSVNLWYERLADLATDSVSYTNVVFANGSWTAAVPESPPSAATLQDDVSAFFPETPPPNVIRVQSSLAGASGPVQALEGGGAAGAPQTHVFISANSDYHAWSDASTGAPVVNPAIKDLAGVAVDAKNIANTMTDNLNVNPSNVHTIDTGSKQDFINSVNNANIQPNDNVLVYTGGHGNTDGTLFFPDGSTMSSQELSNLIQSKSPEHVGYLRNQCYADNNSQALKTDNSFVLNFTDNDSVAWTDNHNGADILNEFLQNLKNGQDWETAAKNAAKTVHDKKYPQEDKNAKYDADPKYHAGPKFDKRTPFGEYGNQFREMKRKQDEQLKPLNDALKALSGAVDAAGKALKSLWDLAFPPAQTAGELPGDSASTRLVASFDPNDILGPTGYGPENFVAAGQTLNYTIRFENDPVLASAAVQVVSITQKLDDDLDPRSVRLGDFGFGATFFEMPANRAFFQERLDLTAEHGIFVDVIAGVDVEAGEVFWVFTSIDPATGAQTRNALDGFLPPNLADGEGEGFVSYYVQADAGAPTGTRVDALARIVFDTNEPIDTPAIFHTLDAVAPASSVTALPPQSGALDGRFLVQWTGADDAGGAGIEGYTIYVSDNGAAFVPWLIGVTENEAVFLGEAGHTYAFYSVARDNAGNVEAAPGGPDATTSVAAGDTLAPNSLVHALPSQTDDPAILVQWSGQDEADGSGLAFFDVYVSIDDGPYAVWQAQTTSTSATYLGANHHTYAFYSVATDVAGNVEAAPPQPDAQTQIEGTGTISGQKFEDLDGDGVKDPGEPGRGGWTIFLDADNGGSWDAGELSTVTNEQGGYSFTGLLPGVYYVAEVMQPGWIQTSPGATPAASVIPLDGTGAVAEAAVSGVQNVGQFSSTPADALIGLDQFRADPRFAGIDGRGFNVVVLDTGIHAGHPFFNDARGAAIVYQYDFVHNDASAADRNGHGTNVASLIAARDDEHSGVAPGAGLIVLQVLDDSGTGSFATVERGLQWVVTHAAEYHVAAVNLSFGDGGNYSQNVALYGIGDELAALAAANVTVVAAAGNNYRASGSAPGLAYPAADPHVVPAGAVWASVAGGPFVWRDGSTDYSTAPDRIASFSQREPHRAQLFAPGALMVGAGLDGGTATYSGTSMAAPEIAGVVALAQQLAVQSLGRMLTNGELRHLLAVSGTTIVDAATSADNVQHTGAAFQRLNVPALGEAILTLPAQPGGGAATGAPGPEAGGAVVYAAGSRSVSVTHNGTVAGVDFGNFRTITAEGHVLEDRDGSPATTADRTPLAHWTVTLTQGATTRTATSDEFGAYGFSNLGPGAYTITPTPPSGWVPLQGGTGYPFTATSSANCSGLDFVSYHDTAPPTVTWLLDFDSGSGTTAPGYVGVRLSQRYGSAGAGYGWDSAAPAAADFDRGTADALYRDGHYGQDATFLVDVAPGDYLVNPVLGDATPFAHDRIELTAQGASTPQLTVSTTAGQWSSPVFAVTVNGGPLSLRLRDAGGVDPNFVINAVRVRPKPELPMTIQRSEPAGGGALDADGTSTDLFQGTGAPAFSWLTVATTLGTVPAGQDGDALLQGVQVQADGAGVFTFQIQRPSGTGGSGNATATITAQEALGRNLGSTTQEYQPAQTSGTLLRFDFNASATYTHDGFTGVGPRDLYNGTRGYGWSVRVAAADRNPGGSWSHLNRDLHTGSNATFRVQVGAGPYNVRVYLPNPLGNGTYAYTYDNFDVIVEGSSKTASVATLTPGAIRIEEFTDTQAGHDTNGDGVLDIQFVDRGGQNFNWVVSGVEVSTGSLGTAVNYLMAAEAAPSAVGSGVTIDAAMLKPVVAEAVARWTATGLTPAQAAILSDLHVGVADLGGATLGLAYPTTNEVRIDDDAAGWGWDVQRSAISGRRSAGGGSLVLNPASRTLNPGPDLVTAVMHEIGHLLGYRHEEDDLMAPVLAASPRRASASGSGLWTPDSGLSAVVQKPLNHWDKPSGERGLHPSSFILHPSSRLDDVLANLALDRGQESPQARVPRLGRLQRYEREVDAWFADLAVDVAGTDP